MMIRFLNVNRKHKKEHFSVPADYFDTVTDRVMLNLNDKQPSENESIGHPRIVSISTSRRWITTVAAVFIASLTVFTGLRIANRHHSQIASASVDNSSQVQSSAYLNEVSNYVMLDNSDMYSYVSETQK